MIWQQTTVQPNGALPPVCSPAPQAGLTPPTAPSPSTTLPNWKEAARKMSRPSSPCLLPGMEASSVGSSRLSKSPKGIASRPSSAVWMAPRIAT
ncbi:hypothetical protein SE15_00745 [Thermanaerothrix daxensis]|uniref:Uncharacterized protein n=1 Tax=Thermanaerothrix daxensis TaxID=869279 RepID=A0A0P6Y362_9CHLR|nr:hypothetical protein SE15_00745 [Thermanaerothrix daxensis]